MKKFLKLLICFLMLIVSVFAINSAKVNETKNIEADSLYTEVVDDNGNVVKHRNSSEAVMRLKEYNYPNQELRACWVSNFVGSLPAYQNEEQWKEEYSKVLDRMEAYGLNCIIFHIRTHNNAMYKSELNPLAKWFYGVNFDEFDPLEWSIEETHRRGIEFHAWLNPYRINDTYVAGDYPEGNPGNDPSKVLSYNGSTILNPGIQSNRDFIVDTCMEVVENYDVDAIHFDDYFYISGVEGDKSADWKRQQVDLFIEDLSNHLDNYNKANNKAVQLGISPSGIYQNGGYSTTPKYDSNGNLTSPLYSNTSGFAHYGSYLYSDTLKWINEEWIDYIMPQTYWSLEQSGAQFGSLSMWWSWAVAKKDVNLYLGMGIYMPVDGNSNWRKNKYEIRDQILNGSMYDEVGGFSLYSYNYMTNSDVYIKTGMDILKNDYWAAKIPCDVKKALADDFKLLSPKNVRVDGTTLSWDAQDTARGYIVYKVPKSTVINQQDLSQIYYYGKELSVELDNPGNYVYYVSVVNLANEIGEPFNTESIAVSSSNVIDAINNLPDVVASTDEGNVYRIKELYDSLSSSEQAKVTNYQKLLTAIELVEVKIDAIDDIENYLDKSIYSTDYQKTIKEKITEFTNKVESALDKNSVINIVEDYITEVDTYPIAKDELKTFIDDATKQLNEFYQSIDLSYYKDTDRTKITSIYEYNLNQIANGLSETAIYKSLETAKKNINAIEDYKEEYLAQLEKIHQALNELIQEKIAENEILAEYEEKLMEIKDQLVTEATLTDKYDVATSPELYISQLQYKLNIKFTEIEEYASVAKSAIEEIKTYEDKTLGHKALKEQYIKAIEDVSLKEDVESLLAEFKEVYANYQGNDVTPPAQGGSCLFVSVNLMISLLTVVSLMYLAMRKK